jgi:DNA-binding GntR family transcriptional regulator
VKEVDVTAAPGPSSHDGAARVRTGCALTGRMRSAVARGDPLGCSELSHLMHRRIQAISGQRTAIATIERLRGQVVRHQFQLALQPGRPTRSLEEHERIADVVSAGEPERAEAAM